MNGQRHVLSDLSHAQSPRATRLLDEDYSAFILNNLNGVRSHDAD